MCCVLVVFWMTAAAVFVSWSCAAIRRAQLYPFPSNYIFHSENKYFKWLKYCIVSFWRSYLQKQLFSNIVFFIVLAVFSLVITILISMVINCSKQPSCSLICIQCTIRTFLKAELSVFVYKLLLLLYCCIYVQLKWIDKLPCTVLLL